MMNDSEFSFKKKMMPIKYFMIYFIFTYLIFILSDASSKIDNLYTLNFYVLMFYIFLYFGYWLGVRTKKIDHNKAYFENIKFIKILIIFCSLYYTVWGINLIIDFGGNNLVSIVGSIIKPGESYQNKFDVFAYRENEVVVNRLTQILILFSFLSSIFVIILVVYWSKISFLLKTLAIFSIVIYLSSYLYIGTQKGLGDVIAYFVVGISLLIVSGHQIKNKNILKFLIAIVFISMFSYMIFNQGLRAVQFGQNSSVLFDNIHNSYLAKKFGEQIAFGFYNTIGYPSHGYLGLSYNLSQDYIFSYGAGLSPAFESYNNQFFGGETNLIKTYPFRTEVTTGWPAGMYWATAFPWIASDLTFPGTILFMFIIGFLFSRVWIKAITHKDILSYAVLGQLAIFLFYLPANNQVLMQRQGFWIVLSIIGLYILRELRKKKYYA